MFVCELSLCIYMVTHTHMRAHVSELFHVISFQSSSLTPSRCQFHIAEYVNVTRSVTS